MVAALRDRTVDVGLLREPPTDDAELAFGTVLTEPFVAVLPSGQPLAARPTVGVGQLADSPFVLLPRAVGPRLYDRITGLCTTAGFTLRVVQHAVEWQTVCALVEAGLGVSLAPESIRRIRLEGVAFRGIGPGSPRTSVAVAWRANDPNPLVARLLETLGQRPSGAPWSTPRGSEGRSAGRARPGSCAVVDAAGGRPLSRPGPATARTRGSATVRRPRGGGTGWRRRWTRG
ncbi:LysR family substrate-binding domain-containing protein [Streptomyces wedmorensis]|uniref:LysR family substrate-binding domain-containing protein n=1 Tax=Streptomyces wedmorensis TaxID=43759 RepID=A0ABW6IZ39_STRWE